MPNWIRTELNFQGKQEDVETLLKTVITVEDGERVFDFRKIIPYPKYWECPEKYLVLPSQIKVRDRDNPFSESGLYAKDFCINVMEEYPYLDWYTWHCDNWGTKWNAGVVDITENTVAFRTAWAFARPVVEKLSKMFPSIEISYRYADEDLGNNCGSGFIVNGVFSCDELDDFNAMRMAISLWGLEEDFEVVNGEWRYIEE